VPVVLLVSDESVIVARLEADLAAGIEGKKNSNR
jgi:hypothetical protein